MNIEDVVKAVKNSTQEEHQAYLNLLTNCHKNKPLSEREIRSVFRNEFYCVESKKYYKYSN